MQAISDQIESWCAWLKVMCDEVGPWCSVGVAMRDVHMSRQHGALRKAQFGSLFQSCLFAMMWQSTLDQTAGQRITHSTTSGKNGEPGEIQRVGQGGWPLISLSDFREGAGQISGFHVARSVGDQAICFWHGHRLRSRHEHGLGHRCEHGSGHDAGYCPISHWHGHLHGHRLWLCQGWFQTLETTLSVLCLVLGMGTLLETF